MVSSLGWPLAVFVLGFAGGLRTMMAICVLCWFARLGHLPVAGTWAFWVAKPVSVVVFTLLAIGELIGDKLPQTPNRTSALPLIARIGFGGVVGAVCATGLHGSLAVSVIAGAFGAVAGAFGGYFARRFLVKLRGLRDLPIALAEDALTLGLSVLALGIVTGR